MSMLDWINPIRWVEKLIASAGTATVNVVGAFSGNQRDRYKQDGDRYRSALAAYASESAPNGTRWDSFWNGINRMPRPMIVVAIFCYFGLAYENPTEFQILNIALDTVPEQMWWVMSAVIGFYFAAREFHKNREKKLALSDDDFQLMSARISALRKSEEKKNESGRTGKNDKKRSRAR